MISLDPKKELKLFYEKKPLSVVMSVPNDFQSLINVYFKEAETIPGLVKEEIENFVEKYHFKLVSTYHYMYIEMQKEDADLLGNLFEKFDFAYTISNELLELMQLQYSRRYTKVALLDTDKLELPFKPYSFQLDDARIMLDKKKLILASEMGAGKTLVAVLVGESLPKKKLVICPETLRINWEREIKQVNPAADVSIIYNAKKCRISNDWNIIGYASISKLLDTLLAEQFDVVFLDEAHLTKSIANNGNPTSKRGKAAVLLAKQAQFCFPMTGTPIANSNRDVYNLLAMICHPITMDKWSFLEFGKKYCDGQHNGFGWDFSGNSHNEELYDILNDNHTMIRHLKKDVLPHLKKQRMFIPVEVAASKIEAQLNESVQKALQEGKQSNFLSYAMTGRLLLATEKIKQTIEFADTILEQNKHVIIVDSFNEPLDTVVEHYGRDNVAIIRGGMTDKEKFAEVDAFQSGQKKICAMNIIAGGVGINLTASYNLIFNSYDWLPANMVQCEDRICRGNQKELCNIYYMYANNVELDKIFTSLLTDKFFTINTAVDGGNEDAVNMTEEILKAIFSNKKVKNGRGKK